MASSGSCAQVIDSYPDRLLIGEIYLPVDRLVTYYGKSSDGLHLPFNFQLIQAPWRAEVIRDLIARVRSRAAGWRLAELGAVEPRPAAHRRARRRGAGAHRGDAAADAARHADALLWRRDRHRRRACAPRRACRTRGPGTSPRRASTATRRARRCSGRTRRTPASAPPSRGCR